VTKNIDYNTIAAAYANDREIHPCVSEALYRYVDETSIVLEVGCGTGNYIVALRQETNCACWGVDLSRGMLDQRRARSEEVSFLQSSAEQLAFPDKTFDLIFSVDVIHHNQDKQAYISEACRLLKEKGLLFTATDSEWVIRNREPLSVYFPESVDVELKRYPKIDDLREWMREAGLQDIGEETVRWDYELGDARAFRDKVFSSLHMISEETFKRGLARLESDLSMGSVPCVSRYTLFWGYKDSRNIFKLPVKLARTGHCAHAHNNSPLKPPRRVVAIRIRADGSRGVDRVVSAARRTPPISSSDIFGAWTKRCL